MILSQKKIEEIAVAVIRDFQKSFFGSEADDPARFALPTPIDQFASDYLNLKVSFQKLSSDGSIYGKRVKHTVKPVLGERAAHNGKVVYSLDFEVTPHLLRHTYITNLIHASVDPKTVQYLAGHENSKITMDIYAKAKYNRPDELAGILEDTFTLWDAE